MNGVIVRENEPFEKTLRRFTKVCERSGVLSELKKYRQYEKPSEAKKRKLNSARRRRIMDLRKENQKKRRW